MNPLKIDNSTKQYSSIIDVESKKQEDVIHSDVVITNIEEYNNEIINNKVLQEGV